MATYYFFQSINIKLTNHEEPMYKMHFYFLYNLVKLEVMSLLNTNIALGKRTHGVFFRQ